MNINSDSKKTPVSVRNIVITLFLISLALGCLHFFWGDVKKGGIRWFNLDKEFNLPTWFSGGIFAFFGIMSLIAYVYEKNINIAHAKKIFRMPILWIGVALIGFGMSLDEITVLHENLFWKEVRQVSTGVNHTFVYVTQWILLFLPVIILFMLFFCIFFYNRFKINRKSLFMVFCGLGFWISAVFLESIRQTFINIGKDLYNLEIVIEELLEMGGGILFLSAILSYVIEISKDMSEERAARIIRQSKFITKKTLYFVFGVLFIFGLGSFITYRFAVVQEIKGSPETYLHKLAVKGEKKNKVIRPEIVKGVWFDDIKFKLKLPDEDLDKIVKRVWNLIKNTSKVKGNLLNSDISIGEKKIPLIGFISVSDGNSPATIVLSRESNIQELIKAMVKGVKMQFEDFEKIKWMKIDIVKQVYKFKCSSLKDKDLRKYDRSLYGLASDRSLGLAFLPEVLLSKGLLNNSHNIRSDKINSYISDINYGCPMVPKIYPDDVGAFKFRFNSYSRFISEDKSEPIKLYRGHIEVLKPTKELVNNALISGSEYLQNKINKDGSFDYDYYAKSDTLEDDYNILRHSGTIYSLAQVYEYTKDESLLSGIKKAIDYLLQQSKNLNIQGNEYACIEENGDVKLGGNGLACLALCEYMFATGDMAYIDDVINLGEFITKLMSENGQFWAHMISYPTGEIENFYSEYYPGEALYGLIKIYELTKDEKWLNFAGKGINYLVNTYYQSFTIKNITHDHWLLYAIAEYLKYRNDESFVIGAYKIADGIISKQKLNRKFPDWNGSYYNPPRSTPTATRTEGLLAALRIAEKDNNKERAAKYLLAVTESIRFQLGMQLREPDVMYLPNPQGALGGFKYKLTNFEVRIDYVQHNISSLLGALPYIDK